MTEAEIQQHADAVRTVGYTLLPGLVPAPVVAEMTAAFQPLYDARMAEIREQPNRGPMRQYIVLPFAPPFFQPALAGNPAIIAILRRLLGGDFYCTQLASDTPAKGSTYQDWHNDIRPIFPDYDETLLPPSVIAINMPLVDVHRDNGPFEVCDGSHRIPDAIARLKAGELPHKALYMTAGDVMIRDPRCVHRGSPNLTDTPRPVVVMGFDRGNHRRDGHFRENSIATSFYETLSDVEKAIYRHVPRV